MFFHLVLVPLVDRFANWLSTTRGTLGVKRTFWYNSSFCLHAYHFLDANRWLCAVEDDCVRPCLVKLQSSLLSKFQIAPIYRILMRFSSFFYGAILGFVKSHGVSSKQLSSSIGFTTVKNTDCLPLLRLCPPSINPLLIVECIPLTFPTWWMYSVNSFGNSTLSCNSGSIAIPPECLWIDLQYRICLEELGFKQH